MADNVTYTLAANSTPPAGTPVASDDIGGVQYQRVKLTLGADGAADNDVDSGQQVMAASVPVVIASDQSAIPFTAASLPIPTGAATEATLATRLSESDFDTKAGSLTEAAPATDTASSGLNGRLQRIAQRITSLIALLPTSLGQKAMAASLAVVVASDQSAVPVSGTVTANAGTNLNTSALALEAGGNLAAAATSLAILDDWDESDRAKVNPIAGQAGVQGGSGGVSALTQRVVLATDVALPAGTNNIGDVDVLTLPALPAGGNSIGTLGANSGVDIGDVTINNAAGASAVNIQDGGNTITVDGTITASNTAGDVAHDSPDSGNPVKMGGKGYAPDTGPADVAASDRTNLFTDLKGRPVVYLATALDETNDKVRAVTEGYKTTYSAGFAALAPAVAATDILEIIGSGTKTIRILRIQISGVATAAGAYNVQLIKRSTAATGGTSTSATIVPHDSANAAGTAVVKGYTANPTVGTIVGITRSQRITVSTGAGAIPIVPVVFDFTVRNGQGIVLRGVAQTLCLSLAAATMTGGLLDIDVEFSEE